MRPHTNTLLIAALLFLFALTACQKEIKYAHANASNSPVNVNDFTGDYDFAGMVAHTQSTVTVVDQGQTLKSVTVSDYVTKNNVGTTTITGSQFIGNGIGYSIDTVVHVKNYNGDVLVNELDVPFVGTAPPTSTISPYIQVTADSITITGDFGVLPDPSGNVPTGPVGLKLSWSGDTLLLKTNSTFTQNVTQNGVPGVVTGTVSGVIKLKKH